METTTLERYVKNCFLFEDNEDSTTVEHEIKLHYNLPQNEDFITLIVNIFRDIAADSYGRLNKCRTLSLSEIKELGVLSGGIWYPHDYFNALKKFQLSERISWMLEGASFNGYACRDSFELLNDSKVVFLNGFVIKKGVLPSEALQNLDRDICLSGCGVLCDIAANKALKQLLYSSKFDILFKDDFRLAADETSTVAKIFKSVLVRTENEIKKGDIVYFSNTSTYLMKHPVGFFGGGNAICCQANPHRYLRLGLPPEGVSRQEMEKNLWRELNADRVDDSFLPDHIWKLIYSKFLLGNEEKNRILISSLKDYTVTWKKFQKMPSKYSLQGEPMKGKLCLRVQRPNAEIIERLAKASLEDVKDVFSNL